MSDELKPCPFCGGPATRNDDEGDPDELYMSCMNIQCCGGDWWFKPDQWQSRPLESALQARVKELEEKLNRDSQFFQAEKGSLKVRIRELEGALPHPFTLRRIATTMQQEVLDMEDAGRIKDMADRIEKVMKKPKEN